jgi:hypothetical protein
MTVLSSHHHDRSAGLGELQFSVILSIYANGKNCTVLNLLSALDLTCLPGDIHKYFQMRPASCSAITTITITEMTYLSLAVNIPPKFMILELFPVSLNALA